MSLHEIASFLPELLIYIVGVCVICCCAGALEHIIYRKEWWLSRFLDKIMCIAKDAEEESHHV